jgi:DNA-binding NtrC family response regulator
MNQSSLLIVDDETSVRESLRLIFGKDFRVSEAKSSEEAIRRVKEESPEIILLDILMPGTDGLEVLKEIKSIDPESQVIMLTALNTARTAFMAKGSGAFDYVTKPFDVNELRLRVNRALEKEIRHGQHRREVPGDGRRL